MLEIISQFFLLFQIYKDSPLIFCFIIYFRMVTAIPLRFLEGKRIRP